MNNNINVISKKNHLLTLNVGEIFQVDNTEYIVLEQLSTMHQTVIIRRKLLEYVMEMEMDDHVWDESNIRKFLNTKYLSEIEKAFGKHRIVEHNIGTLYLDILNYNKSVTDKISLLSSEQYRKYRKIFIKTGNLENAWWLISRCSTKDESFFRIDTCVGCEGAMYLNDGCSWCQIGARPFFIIQS